MKLKSVTIPVSHLLAVAAQAAKDDVRFYLNGVLIEVEDGGVMCVATNGHILGAIRGGEANAAGDHKHVDDTQLIVPIEIIRRLKPSKKFANSAVIITNEAADLWTLTSMFADPIHFKMIDGKFPDWRCVIPVRVSNECGQYDPELLALFSKSDTALNPARIFAGVALAQNGTGPAIVSIAHAPHYFGIIMPMRIEGRVTERPAWTLTKAELAELAAAAKTAKRTRAKIEGKSEAEADKAAA